MKYDFTTNSAKRGDYGKKYDWSDIAAQADHLFCPVENYIPMWIADMDFPVAPEITAAIQARVQQNFLGYTLSNQTQYRNIMLDWFSRRFDWNEITPDQIYCAGGIISSLETLIRHTVSPQKKVLILTPSYAPFAMAILGADRQLDTVALLEDSGHYSIDWNSFEAHVQDPDVQAFILCSPHNPTGHVWTETELRRMGQLCFENNVFVFSDEIHCDIVRSSVTHIPFGKVFPNETKWVVCNAPSKTFNMGGMHFSSLVIPDKNLAEAWSKTEWGYCTHPISLAAAEAAYSKCDNWLHEANAYIDENFQIVADYMKQHLPNAIFHIPQGTYLAWINISAYMDILHGRGTTEFFVENSNVVLESGHGFIGGSENFIRLNLATSHETVLAALESISSALKKGGK